MNIKTLSDPILVGRENELDELKRCLDLAFQGTGSTIFISGEAGSGKTRLANEFLKIAQEKKVTTLTAQCLSKASEPYFPFIEAFDGYLSSFGDVSHNLISKYLNLKSLLVSPANFSDNNKVTISPQIWRDQTFAAIAKEISFLSVQKPIILFLDDIHWADSASLSLLHYISRNMVSERIVILSTYRIEELSAREEGQPHPLLEVLRLMRRESLFEEIKLPSLNESQVVEVAKSMLGGNLKKEFIEKIAEESFGNPLFIVESLRMLYEQGGVAQENGGWQLTVDTLGLPSKVKEVILRRIDVLKPEQRRVLDAASVIGDRFDAELLGSVLNQDSLSILEILNTISHCNSLVCSEEDFFRFDHAKSREVLYDEIRLPLKKGYHYKIAQQLESYDQKKRLLRIGDLAYHYILSGQMEKSIKYSLEAGKDALSRFSNLEAIKHFKYVLNTVLDAPEYAIERTVALEGLGDAFYANCRYEEAIEIFEKLSVCQEGDLKIQAFRKAMDAAFFHGDFTRLMDLAKRTEEYAVIDRLESARVLMNIARAIMFTGDFQAGLTNFEAAIKVFEEEFSLPDVARTSLGLVGIYDGEKGEKGLARALCAVSLCNELGDTRGLMDAYHRAAQSFGTRLLFKEALEMNEKAIRIGKTIGDFNRIAEANDSSAWVLEASGNFDEALSMCLEALEYCEKTESNWTRAITYSCLTRLYSIIGDLEQAEQYLQKLVKLPKEVLSQSSVFVNFDLSRAVFYAAKHMCAEANQYLNEYIAHSMTLKTPLSPALRIKAQRYQAWILTQQNKNEESRIILQAAQKEFERYTENFQNTAIQAMSMVPKEIEAGKEFTIRLDIVNVSRKPCKILRLQGLIPSGFNIKLIPDHCCAQESSILINKTLEPFQVESIKLNLQAGRSGNYSFEPQISFADNSGKNEIFKITSISKNVHPAKSSTDLESIEIKPSKLEFRSETARKAFQFLVNAFVEDYNQLRLPQERCGWRTLMEIVKHGRISKYSAYGFSGNRGQAISEIERLRLIESRVFLGERGRGGKILKLRVNFENGIVKNQINIQSSGKAYATYVDNKSEKVKSVKISNTGMSD